MSHYIVSDLDDCLLNTDLAYEQVLVLLKKNPLSFFFIMFWIFRGKCYFKNKLVQYVPTVPPLMPINDEVLKLLKDEKTKNPNSVLILASASPQSWVEQVAQRIGIFDIFIGSDQKTNLRSKEKLKAIQSIVGNQSFTYIADHAADLPIWEKSSQIVAVNCNKSVRNSISKLNKETIYLSNRRNSVFSALRKQMRPHQWVKNALVFLPAAMAHQILNSNVIFATILAFFGFSFAASFVYVLNDLLDLSADRNHVTKKNRPFASGELPLKWGLIILPSLILATSLFAYFLPIHYWAWIAFYIMLNLAYSFYLKQSVVVDVIVLSMMYTIRIYAGSAAASIPISEWLLSFSTLFFFCLACVKRYTEILRSKNKITIDGRGYRQVDHSIVQSIGVGSGLMSVVIILLYLQSEEVRALYSSPQFLWYIVPILLFWISRIWILANRDEVNDDPVVYAIKDKVSWLCLLAIAVVFGASSWTI